jgi:hypothetical protein
MPGNGGLQARWLLPVMGLLACGGKTTSPAAQTEGSCSLSTAGWSCTTPTADAPRTLVQCPGDVGAGGAPCPIDNTTDTTNTTQPTHTTIAECFACAGNGTGTDWTCASSGWQAAGTLSCASGSSGSGGDDSGSSGSGSATGACAQLTTCCTTLPSQSAEQSGCFAVAASNSSECQVYLSGYTDGGQCLGGSGGTGSSSGGSATEACAQLKACCGTLPSLSVEQSGCYGEASSSIPTQCQVALSAFVDGGRCQ